MTDGGERLAIGRKPERHDLPRRQPAVARKAVDREVDGMIVGLVEPTANTMRGDAALVVAIGRLMERVDRRRCTMREQRGLLFPVKRGEGVPEVLVTEEVVQAQSMPGTLHPLQASLSGNKNRLGKFFM